MKQTIYLLFFLIVFAVSSCEDVIEVNLSDENLNLFGVEASITSLEGPSVFLYKTLRVDANQAYPGISGAEVLISDNASPANKINLVEDAVRKGLYRVPQNMSYSGAPGREYNLTIKTEGVTLTAKDKLSKVEPLDSIQVIPSLRGDKRFLGVFTYGKEPKGLGNFYKWDLLVNDTLIHEASRMAIASDEFVDGNYIAKLEIYTDFYQPDNEETDRKLKIDDVVQVKQNSISEFA